MKYWTITFPGEFGQHVVETWSEDQIIESYYTYWCGKMIQNVPNPDLDHTKCIKDWCDIHSAVELNHTYTYGDIDYTPEEEEAWKAFETKSI